MAMLTDKYPKLMVQYDEVGFARFLLYVISPTEVYHILGPYACSDSIPKPVCGYHFDKNTIKFDKHEHAHVIYYLREKHKK